MKWSSWKTLKKDQEIFQNNVKSSLIRHALNILNAQK